MKKTASQIQKEPIKEMKRCIKESFSVIGKEGSSDDGPGFVQNLWADANSHFAEVAHLAKKDENGNFDQNTGHRAVPLSCLENSCLFGKNGLQYERCHGTVNRLQPEAKICSFFVMITATVPILL